MTRLRWIMLGIVLAGAAWGAWAWQGSRVGLPGDAASEPNPIVVQAANQTPQPLITAGRSNSDSSQVANSQAGSSKVHVESGRDILRTSAAAPIEETSREEALATAETVTATPAEAAAESNPAADLAGEASFGVAQDSPATPAAPHTINLLSQIDLDRDIVKGDWQFDSGQLSSPPEVNQARIEIPGQPPAEYRLRMVVERGAHGKYTTLGLGLVAGGHQFYVILDSNESEGSLGLDLLDGKSWNQNTSTRKIQVLTDGVPAEVVCTVRESGLQVHVDGRVVLEWKGDYNRLSLYPAWAVPHKQQLFLGTDCNYVISHLELTPLSESASATSQRKE